MTFFFASLTLWNILWIEQQKILIVPDKNTTYSRRKLPTEQKSMEYIKHWMLSFCTSMLNNLVSFQWMLGTLTLLNTVALKALLKTTLKLTALSFLWHKRVPLWKPVEDLSLLYCHDGNIENKLALSWITTVLKTSSQRKHVVISKKKSLSTTLFLNQ